MDERSDRPLFMFGSIKRGAFVLYLQENNRKEMKMMQLETERLLLRPWLISDATDLYEYAKDPAIGPMAGWPPHTSVENSMDIIKQVLSIDETYAVVLKETSKVVGSIGLMIGEQSSLTQGEHEAEIGYWIGVPYWGKGLIPEAVKELIRYAFEDLEIETLWCGYYEGNIKSKRTQEKCGFQYHHIEALKAVPLLKEIRNEYVTCLPKATWKNQNIK